MRDADAATAGTHARHNARAQPDSTVRCISHGIIAHRQARGRNIYIVIYAVRDILLNKVLVPCLLLANEQQEHRVRSCTCARSPMPKEEENLLQKSKDKRAA